MFVLALFTDLVFHVCLSKDVSALKSKCPAVKYIDKKKYTARILAMHESRELLESICNNLNNDVTSVHLGTWIMTNRNQPYADIIKKKQVHKGTNILYLDPSLLPSPGQEFEHYVFSLHGKEAENTFFDKQPHFIETEILPGVVEIKKSFEANKEQEKEVMAANKTETLTVTPLEEKLCEDLMKPATYDEMETKKNEKAIVHNGTEITAVKNRYLDKQMLDHNVEAVLSSANGENDSTSLNLQNSIAQNPSDVTTPCFITDDITEHNSENLSPYKTVAIKSDSEKGILEENNRQTSGCTEELFVNNCGTDIISKNRIVIDTDTDQPAIVEGKITTKDDLNTPIVDGENTIRLTEVNSIKNGIEESAVEKPTDHNSNNRIGINNNDPDQPGINEDIGTIIQDSSKSIVGDENAAKHTVHVSAKPVFVIDGTSGHWHEKSSLVEVNSPEKDVEKTAVEKIVSNSKKNMKDSTSAKEIHVEYETTNCNSQNQICNDNDERQSPIDEDKVMIKENSIIPIVTDKNTTTLSFQKSEDFIENNLSHIGKLILNDEKDVEKTAVDEIVSNSKKNMKDSTSAKEIHVQYETTNCHSQNQICNDKDERQSPIDEDKVTINENSIIPIVTDKNTTTLSFQKSVDFIENNLSHIGKTILNDGCTQEHSPKLMGDGEVVATENGVVTPIIHVAENIKEDMFEVKNDVFEKSIPNAKTSIPKDSKIDENENIATAGKLAKVGYFVYDKNKIIISSHIQVKSTESYQTDKERVVVDPKSIFDEEDAEAQVSSQHQERRVSVLNNDINAPSLANQNFNPRDIDFDSSSSIKSEMDCTTTLDDLLSGNCFLPENVSDVPSLNDSLIPPVISSTFLNSDAIDSRLLDTATIGTEDTATNNKDIWTSGDESSGEEYAPSASEDSDIDMNCREDGETVQDDSKSHDNKKNKNRSVLHITLGSNKPGQSAPDDEAMEVMNSKITPSYSKKHFCLYCQSFKSKIARHLEMQHSDEKAVKEFVVLKPGDKKRQSLIAKIRKAGDHLYNTDGRFNQGNLVVVRRPQEKLNKTAKDFIACGQCRGQYSRAVIRHHWRKCTNRQDKKERIVMLKGRTVSGRIHEKANEIVRKYIFPYLREDDIVRGIRYDELVVLYANQQAEKYGTHQHHYQMIRSRIRLLGRFLYQIKKVNRAIKTFSDVFIPRHYDDAITAVKIIGGLDKEKLTFAAPATASNIGTLLKHIGELQRSEYIKSERAHDQKRVEDFLKLQAADYTISINRAVAETQAQNARRKKVILPSLNDITKLHDYLKNERIRYFEALQKKFSMESWRKLAENTVISLQLFNRRRPGEIQRVYIEDFDSHQTIDKVSDKDAYSALSEEGRALARKYVRFMIRGKRGRGVPVLVPAEVLDCLILIKRHRQDAGVSTNNPYIFGIPSINEDVHKHLLACDLMRSYSQRCGADVPETLRGTQLRKHIATKCINLNLSETQVTDLANFMGHHEKIHKEIYRQPLIQNDIIKISQLLEMAQGTHPSVANDEESSSEDEGYENNATSKKGATRKTSDVMPDLDEGNESVDPASLTGGSSQNVPKRNSNTSVNRSVSRVSSGHRRWTDAERDAVLSAFEPVLRKGNMPTGAQIQKLINDNRCLRNREVPQVRTWLHTQKKKMF